MQQLHTPYAKIADNTNTNTNRGDNNVFLRPRRGRAAEPASSESQTTASHTGGAAPTDSYIDESKSKTPQHVIELADEIAALFKVSETKFFHQYAKIRTFVKVKDQAGEFDNVRTQFHAYKAQRGATGTRVHKLDNWLGSAESNWLLTSDGKAAAWAEKDWVEEMVAQDALAASRPPRETGRQRGSHLAERGGSAAEALARLRAQAASENQKSENQNQTEETEYYVED